MLYTRDNQPLQIDEPGLLTRPQIPQRLIVVPDPPPQHANRPLPPTPRSSGSPGQPQQVAAPQQPQRNSQSNMFKPVVSKFVPIFLMCRFILFTIKLA